MKKYFQHIPGGFSKKKGQEDKFVPGRRVQHDKPLTAHQLRFVKLRKWLSDNYGVESFTKLKQRGQELVEIRRKGLTHAGFVNFRA